MVHAPYKTTPSRESIPFDDSQNQLITTALSALIAESIIGLKNSGLLDVKALSILPTYYGPTSRLNGNTAKDIVYGGTPLEKKFETVKF